MTASSSFRISGLPIDSFRFLFSLSDNELTAHRARIYVANAKPGFPCRVSLVDAEIGESVILVPYIHHAVNGPYNSSGPIFVRENAVQANLEINEIPEVLRRRLISVRAYDSEGLLVASEVVDGGDLEKRIGIFFADNNVRYLHLHNAKPGCYSCRVDRAV